MDNYEKEAKELYSKTKVYKEYEVKTKNYTTEKWEKVNEGLNAIFSEFACLKDTPATSDKTQTLVKRLQEYISENYYTCTDEILEGLGQMYTSDPRFKENIDKYGEGTTEFVASAITHFCKAK